MGLRKSVRVPKDARTLDQVCDLPRDNVSSGEFWMLTDGYTVTLARQKTGEMASESISIPKQTFDRFMRWYETGSMR